jgi:5'(3')-deoxyribonucleotidase
MNNQFKIFLDMDQVIGDFVTAVCKVHGRENPYLQKENLGIWHMEDIWRITAQEFWQPMNEAGWEFWAHMPVLPDAHELVELLVSKVGVENVCILSSPSNDPQCIPGKRFWMIKNFPALQKNLLFGSAKRFLAGPNRVLIDDREENVLSFIQHGGAGILIPRPCNRHYTLSNDPLQYVRYCLEQLGL